MHSTSTIIRLKGSYSVIGLLVFGVEQNFSLAPRAPEMNAVRFFPRLQLAKLCPVNRAEDPAIFADYRFGKHITPF